MGASDGLTVPFALAAGLSGATDLASIIVIGLGSLILAGNHASYSPLAFLLSNEIQVVQRS